MKRQRASTRLSVTPLEEKQRFRSCSLDFRGELSLRVNARSQSRARLTGNGVGVEDRGALAPDTTLSRA